MKVQVDDGAGAIEVEVPSPPVLSEMQRCVIHAQATEAYWAERLVQERGRGGSLTMIAYCEGARLAAMHLLALIRSGR